MEIRNYTIDGILVLELKGELKNKILYKIKPFILEIVSNDCKRIILDMSNVKGADKSWCDYLARMYKVMIGYGRRLVIANCPAIISDADYAKKVKTLYTLCSSVEEALSLFQTDLAICRH